MLLAWLIVLAPTLAFAAIGLLGSVAFGRSPMGLVIPALLASEPADRATASAARRSVRVVLPSYGFIAWRGLFTDPAQTGPPIVGVAVSLAVAVAASALAYRLFMRRDFTDLAYDGAGRRALVGAVLPLVAVFAVDRRRDCRRDLGLQLRDRQSQAGPVALHGVRAPLSHADRRAASPQRHRGRTADQRLV